MFDHVTVRVADWDASEGEPGQRPRYHCGFLRDPDRNSVEAVNHSR